MVDNLSNERLEASSLEFGCHVYDDSMAVRSVRDASESASGTHCRKDPTGHGRDASAWSRGHTRNSPRGWERSEVVRRGARDSGLFQADDAVVPLFDALGAPQERSRRVSLCQTIQPAW